MNLREADSIVITPADKGNATVVMDRNDYDRKIRTLLADADVYKRLPKDATPATDECPSTGPHKIRHDVGLALQSDA